MESRGKAIRWQHLVPIPSGGSLGDVSEALLAGLDGQQDKRRSDEASGRPIGELFAEERGSMLPLPAHPFAAQRLPGSDDLSAGGSCCGVVTERSLG